MSTTTISSCSDSESITYVVNSVPTLNAIANQGTYIAAGSQSVALSGISDGGWGDKTLSVTATSSNTSVVPHPSITYTSPNTSGTLNYSPNSTGDAIITVTVSYFNVQTVSTTRTFTIHVDNKPPNPTSISATASTICYGNNTQLTANGVQGTVYWYTGSCGGTATSPATGNSITVSPSVTTTYYARNYDNSLFSTGCAAITITVEQTAISGSFAKTPNSLNVCQGTNVSAILTAGSGGNGNDETEYRTYAGTWSSWANYASGTNIATTGKTAVEIRTRRLANYC